MQKAPASENDSAADWIGQELEKSGLSVAQLAEKAGIDPSTAWRWAKGIGNFSQVKAVLFLMSFNSDKADLSPPVAAE